MKDIKREIISESQAFVKQNKGLLLGDEKMMRHYISPRISSEYMDCSMPMTFDHYSHCSLGCTYCFAYMFKTTNTSFNEKLHSVNWEKTIDTIRGKPGDSRQRSIYKHFIKKRFLFHWGGMADPFCNFEKANDVGYKIIEALAEENYPTLFSFKGSAIFRPKFTRLFEEYAHQNNFAFQISMVTGSDEMARQVEIGVPVPSRRLKAMKILSDMGYFTILRLRPYIIGVTDKGIDELLEQSLEAGIQAISMEFMAIDSRSNEALMKRYRWLGEIIGAKDIMKYFKSLSPSERGGYLRLNRLVKERYVKQIYEFCLENDIIFACSDPDFKELNMTGSCCGMPDKYPENKEMCNWTHNQLTHHLKEARRVYHTSGRIYKFRFKNVFKPDDDTYLKSVILGQDHVSVSDKTASERYKIGYINIARQVWNNLRSPGNPRNYFNGKILPFTTDEDENLVYKYVPSEYEERWTNEGIDLTS
jgi:DNA repair photolyase